MAHKTGGGSTRKNKDSISKRLGVKIFGGQFAKAGAVLVRQRGTKYHPGANVGKGVDDTLFARAAGIVHFDSKQIRKIHQATTNKRLVSIEKTTEKS